MPDRYRPHRQNSYRGKVAHCPVCGRTYGLTTDGLINPHQPLGLRCKGSLATPEKIFDK